MKDTSLAQLTQEFQRYKWKIPGISEMRWKESGEQKKATGETVIPTSIRDSYR